MIVRDEERVISRCLESVIGIVDEVVIVDTGSIDGTVSEVKRVAGDKLKLFTYEWNDDFSSPRNLSFEKASCDFIFWLDADDVVINPEALKLMIDRASDSFDILNLKYNYAYDEYKNPVMVHWRERVIRNTPNACRWVDRVHEHLLYDPQTVRCAHFEDTVIGHLRDSGAGNRASSRNLHILENWIKESGGYESATERQLVYLGNERWVNNLIAEAIEAYNAYLSKSNWDEEKLQVHYKLATYYIETKQYRLAYNHATSALIINPAWVEPWLALAQLQLNEGKYSNARVFLNRADECTPPNTPLVIYPLNYSYLPKVLRYKVNLLEGNLEDALLDIQKCLKVRPSEELTREYAAISAECERRRDVEAVVRLADSMDLQKLPDNIKAEPVVQKLLIERTVSWTGKTPRISFYTGQFVEPWGPPSLTTTGLGGSETAVIYVAARLAELGADVRVYGEPGPWIGQRKLEHRNDSALVTYLPAQYFDPTEEVDVFISSRIPSVFDYPISAKEKCLWVHDTTLGDGLTTARLENIDHVLAVSEWQAKQYKNLYGEDIAEKLFITGNGIDPAMIEKAAGDGEIEKDPLRFMYSSSPDRGLIELLDIWPNIYKDYPSASLHIYYGWNVFDACAEYNPAMKALKASVMKRLDSVSSMNVHQHGRISQLELYREALKSSWYLYPTLFCETFCITALEALACGVTFIGSDRAALSDTLQGHGILIPGSPAYPNVKAKFVEAVHQMVSRQKKEPDIVKREKMEGVRYSLSRTWDSVADGWVNGFLGDYF